jgi:paraquat-inducible protein A
MSDINDIQAHAVLCSTCGELIDRDSAENALCPVCNHKLHLRKKSSLQKTWALTIAALLLYIPANLLPVMSVDIFGDKTSNTILEGVVQFYEHKMYFIAIVVFTASFVVPLFKISALFYLLITINSERGLSKLKKTKLFHVIEYIGKWSMLDVFVVAIMAGLINTGYVINISGGLGIVFFAAVVILTMKASASFDTRLIWDTQE